VPGAWKVDGQKVVTYWEAILQDKLPKSVVVIGSGAIGVEFSTVWNSYGVDVTIVEMLPRLVPLEDEEISKELEKEFKKRGIKSMIGHKVESVEATATGVKVKVSAEGKETVLEADQALVAIGFRPNSKGLGLEDVGVKISERGFVEVNEKMQTNVPGIWAIGDVTGKLMLAHVGSAMGIICAENIAGVETTTLDYEMMPRATYCHPQIASFGLTEAQAKERGYTIKVGRFPFQANGKALGLGDYAGFAKIVVDEKYGEILGAHMIGPEVTELLPELTLAHMMELTPHEIARNVHAHPTLSEVLMEAAHGAEGSPIHI
jgi:dihydrolipoamide dehydrogenase